MKKDILYEIYDALEDNNVNVLTILLFKLKNVKGKAEDLLYDLVINHRELFNANTTDTFIDLCTYIGSMENDIYIEDIMSHFKELLDNDIVTSSVEFPYLLNGILKSLSYNYETIFCYFIEDGVNKYRVEVTNYLIDAFNSLKKVDIDKVYKHNFIDILDSFFTLIEDLDNTKEENNMFDDDNSKNNLYLKRIRQFCEIVSNKTIYELSDNKYKCILQTMECITDTKKMNELKAKAIFNKKRRLTNFINIMDECSDELTNVTIKKIYDEIGVKIGHNYDEDYVTIEVPKKSNKDNKNIVKKILKPDKNS